MKSQLDRMAEQHGISLTRPSPENVDVPISDETKRKILSALGVDQNSTDERPKYPPSKGIAKSYLPDFLETGRVWGVNLQLYELRSDRNWGIGDFWDLIEMVRLARSLGADFIGLNPLHAPFLAEPDRCSPYEPSNRQMLNPLYIAVDRLAGFEANETRENQLEVLRQSDLVDYVGVAKVKVPALREIWQAGRVTETADDAAFEQFILERGEVLRRHALFETLSAHMEADGKGAGWRSWPTEYQAPDSAAVSQFADPYADEIRFHMWLQWLAHKQLSEAAAVASEAGMRIGLYLDLAVGEAIDGSATWSEQEVYISDATVGSPPDPFATEGQDWHLAALHPAAIASGKEPPYRRMVIAAMHYAGAIRIDHAAALRRLFLVPLDDSPECGAYVNYPQDALMRILADASTEFECLVIGEDLGMLPEGLQGDLADAGILSYRILSYERGEDGFKPANAYPRLSLACISTHDHQTLAGWWRGADIRARETYGIVPPDISATHVDERKLERRDLKIALEDAGTEPPDRLSPATATDDKLQKLVVSAHHFIAKTPSIMVAVRLADMTGEKHPTNIPGTGDSYPNWKPKLSVLVNDLANIPLVREIAEVMQERRS
ncbi:4-alpha-glucanotransferase [Neorhizobium huautlense]|uniref:4-alpha-glucanotransferase n=1 Tax=Neorhizobium huautlense TaxID=67774 RepID=A0ABT9Q111_9HYPH|nr:4-alpha-glucanotransferase [Neorhizobium huautlense]MDP9840405.1 4-alpha-glucanotransferase [Neorhizobium huautlense]